MPCSSFLPLVLLSTAVFWPAGESGAQAVQHEDQESFTVVGWTVRTSNTREAGPDGAIPQLWGNAMQEGVFNRIPDRADDDLVVVYSGYASDEHGEYDYTLGVRAKKGAAVPEGLVARTIAAGPYVVVQSEKGAPPVIVPAVWKRIWSMTPQELGGHRAYMTDFEVYPAGSGTHEAQIEVHLGLKQELAGGR